VFTPFLNAANAPDAGGVVCMTGLLNAGPQNNRTVCDAHPSLSGHRLIAKTVASAVRGRIW
jgi:hypothetical protein